MLCFGLQRIQRYCGSYGNKAQNSPTISAFLALTAPVLLLSGYFTGMQVYVLHMEFVFGMLALSLLVLQLLFGMSASLMLSSRRRDTGLWIVAALVGVGALVMVGIHIFQTKVTQEALQAALISGAALMGISLVVAIVGCILSVDL